MRNRADRWGGRGGAILFYAEQEGRVTPCCPASSLWGASHVRTSISPIQGEDIHLFFPLSYCQQVYLNRLRPIHLLILIVWCRYVGQPLTTARYECMHKEEVRVRDHLKAVCESRSGDFFSQGWHWLTVSPSLCCWSFFFLFFYSISPPPSTNSRGNSYAGENQ